MSIRIMDKCRLCMNNRKKLYSIFDTDNGISYAEMTTSIANVKIMKEDGITEKICILCRRKVKEMFDFKNMIESSDLTLHACDNLKRINFCNLNEIKVKFEFTGGNYIERNKCFSKFEKIITGCFENGENAVCYKDVVIKKIVANDDCRNDGDFINKEDKPLDVFDFLNTLKDEPTYDYDNNCLVDDYNQETYDNDEIFVPFIKGLKKKKRKKHKKVKDLETNFNNKDHFIKVRIKPVFLEDIRLIRTKKNKENVKKKYKNNKIHMCNYCGKMTKSIKSHLLVHTGERVHKCNMCTRAFFTLHNLQHHMKRHLTENMYKCEQCLAKFNNKESLKRHNVVHENEKRFLCNICNKGFKRICSQPYSYKHDFNQHCLKKHGVYFKRRSVYVMNDEVLRKERELMKELMLRVHGVVDDEEPFKAFQGPQAHMALEQLLKLLQEKQIPIDFHF
ncbi:zinc finger protein 723-like isoform X2 [Galleria mellonella]|uniref:Prothoraticotropic hormone transcript variant X1 n=1 Tax=Galleria mellonella TaxID=7137 RepID=A0A6J3CE07_GALME|nr:zinc finger protein 723-like isoform X2 [Galleria mellonella]WLY76864.1 prothoraticotropic hormone transcript variant X1 [Galleria mellonella]